VTRLGGRRALRTPAQWIIIHCYCSSELNCKGERRGTTYLVQQGVGGDDGALCWTNDAVCSCSSSLLPPFLPRFVLVFLSWSALFLVQWLLKMELWSCCFWRRRKRLWRWWWLLSIAFLGLPSALPLLRTSTMVMKMLGAVGWMEACSPSSVFLRLPWSSFPKLLLVILLENEDAYEDDGRWWWRSEPRRWGFFSCVFLVVVRLCVLLFSQFFPGFSLSPPPVFFLPLCFQSPLSFSSLFPLVLFLPWFCDFFSFLSPLFVRLLCFFLKKPEATPRPLLFFFFCPLSPAGFFWFYPPLECHAVPCSLFLMQE